MGTRKLQNKDKDHRLPTPKGTPMIGSIAAIDECLYDLEKGKDFLSRQKESYDDDILP